MQKSIKSLVIIGSLIASAPLFAKGELITIDEAKTLVGKPNVRFVYADNPSHFADGHIPGSVVAFTRDLHVLSEIKKCDGLPMCPDTASKFISGLGIDANTKVVAYDDGRGANASGVWFFLTLYGHPDVKILEGGSKTWEKKGLKLDKAAAPAKVAAKKFTAKVNKDMIATKSEVQQAIKAQDKYMLLDARHRFEEYTGKSLGQALAQPGKLVTVKRGGFIPTGVFSPWTKYAGNKGGKADKPIFRSDKKLKKQLKKLKKKGYSADKTVISYCHVGLGRGTFQYLALKNAGHDKTKVYVGSWHEWGSDASLPVGKM